MRIVLDLQSCQTEGSKNRGIGRYSIALADAMIRQGADDHEFFIVLNGAFPEAAAAVRAHLQGKIPADRIRTFEPVTAAGVANAPDGWRHRMSSLLREELIASLDPDALHVTSLFEGLGDLSVTDVSPPHDGVIQAVTVYDLIPYINPDPYLLSADVRDWYYRKLKSLKRADLLLAISSSSRDEAIEHLHVPADKVVNISSAISSVFQPKCLTDAERTALHIRYRLRGRFVMYTGGIDHRKNIEGLIEAFTLLDADLRRDRQLAIVCSISAAQREALLTLAEEFGLDEGQVVLTGYVPEDDLIALYNSCEMFVFPSLHEGFGLPVLEAMSCGVPTIGSNSSSIPEVIGYDEALFDPKDPVAIAGKIMRVLRDADFAERLRRQGLEQSRTFSWDESARRALRAIEAAKVEAGIPTIPRDGGPLRLAFLSPFPPLNSGIAGYSASLLPELSRYYDIDVVVDQTTTDSHWASANCGIISSEEFERRSDAGFYNRILYHFGNSEFHAHMPDLLLRHPGVVVLHDYFLSGLQNWRQATGADGVFINALVDSHGYSAIAHLVSAGVGSTIANYPANGPVVRAAAGLIVHSKTSMDRLTRDYGIVPNRGVRHIPLLRVNPVIDRDTARDALGLAADDILICSFGIVAPEKLSHLVLAAFIEAGLSKESPVHLVFVGSAPGAYGEALARQIRATGRKTQISCTGFVDDRAYHMHLAAADLAIQLRTTSRGETSAAALDVLNYGVPLIVNAHGTMTELDRSAVVMLEDPVNSKALAAALTRLIHDPSERAALADAGKALIGRQHSPGLAGLLYRDAIEEYAARHPLSRQMRLLRRAAQSARLLQPDTRDIATFSTAVAHNIVRLGPPRIFVDISGAVADSATGVQMHWVLEAIDVMMSQDDTYRIEPVYMAAGETVFREARQLMTAHLGWHGGNIFDPPISPVQGDRFIGLDCSFHSADIAATQGIFRRLRSHGIPVAHVLRHEDVHAVIGAIGDRRTSRGNSLIWLGMIAEGADVIVTSSEDAAIALHHALDLVAPPRQSKLDIIFPSISVADDGVALIDVAMLPEQERQSIVWTPRLSYYFDGASARFGSVCGERRGRTIASVGNGGALVYGPYLALPCGTYEARILGTIQSDGPSEGFVDAAIAGGRTIIGRADMTPSPEGHVQVAVLARLEFTLDKSCTDLEIRIWINPETDMVFHRLDIRELVPS